jgi:hypothetical protein
MERADQPGWSLHSEPLQLRKEDIENRVKDCAIWLACFFFFKIAMLLCFHYSMWPLQCCTLRKILGCKMFL